MTKPRMQGHAGFSTAERAAIYRAIRERRDMRHFRPDPPAPCARARDPRGAPGEAVYRSGRVFASYVHFHFASNPEAAARLLTP